MDQKTQKQIKTVKEMLTANPGLTNDQLAKTLGVLPWRVTGIRKLAKMPGKPGRLPTTKARPAATVTAALPSVDGKSVKIGKAIELASVNELVAALRERAKHEYGKSSQVIVKVVPGTFHV